MLGKVGMRWVFAIGMVLRMVSGASAAEERAWSVSKSSGQVWLAASGVQPVSLSQEGTLKAGDIIRTGRNGRVLLVRGEETILISPNSVVGLPAEEKEGLSNTIIQQAGSILLEVEKRNVKHFEVETPYLAAVVKGTRFSVTVNSGSTKVGVLRGQVEVSDFKSGQIAQVMPGQSATAFEHGKPGLSLGGAGTFNSVEYGKPRASTIERIPVPKSGLTAPRNAASGHAIHALGPIDKGNKATGVSGHSHQATGIRALAAGVVRISGPLGEVKLNIHKVTQGLAHGSAPSGHVRSVGERTDTVWNSSAQPATTNSGLSVFGNSAVSAAAGSPAAAAGGSSDAPGVKSANVGGNNNPGNNNAGTPTSNTGTGNTSTGNTGTGNTDAGNTGSSTKTRGNNGNNGATGNGRGNNGNGNGNGGGNGSNGQGHAYGRR